MSDVGAVTSVGTGKVRQDAVIPAGGAAPAKVPTHPPGGLDAADVKKFNTVSGQNGIGRKMEYPRHRASDAALARILPIPKRQMKGLDPQTILRARQTFATLSKEDVTTLKKCFKWFDKRGIDAEYNVTRMLYRLLAQESFKSDMLNDMAKFQHLLPGERKWDGRGCSGDHCKMIKTGYATEGKMNNQLEALFRYEYPEVFSKVVKIFNQSYYAYGWGGQTGELLLNYAYIRAFFGEKTDAWGLGSLRYSPAQIERMLYQKDKHYIPRYASLGSLLKQVSMPTLVFVHPNHGSDYNGAFYGDTKLIDSLSKVFNVVIVQSEDVNDFIDNVKRIGKNKKITHIVISGHGSSKSVTFCEGDKERCELSRHSYSHGSSINWPLQVLQGAIIVFNACSTGKGKKNVSRYIGKEVYAKAVFAPKRILGALSPKDLVFEQTPEGPQIIGVKFR